MREEKQPRMREVRDSREMEVRTDALGLGAEAHMGSRWLDGEDDKP